MEERSQLELDLIGCEKGVQITLNFDKDTYKKIKKDNTLFNNNGHINNFIIKIIMNYHDDYKKKNNHLKSDIKSYLMDEAKFALNDDQYEKITWKIINGLDKTHIDSKSTARKLKEQKITIKTTNNSRKVFGKITNDKPKDVGVAPYLCSIILSYLNQPSYIREQIIYKDEIKAIQKAIENNQKISFKNKNNKDPHINVSPYAIVPSKEEIYSYLVYQETNKKGQEVAMSVHICNIDWVEGVSEASEFNNEVLECFERMEKNGYQFSIRGKNECKVKLSEDGSNIYNARYLERPEVVNQEEDIYTFDCSGFQLENYFAPFHENAIILAPEYNVRKTIEHYQSAIQKYQKLMPELFDKEGNLI